MSFVYSDPGKYTNEIFDCGGSLFAAAICIFTLEQGKESGGKRNPVYYGCLHHSKRMGVFSRWFFGIFISFYYDDVLRLLPGFVMARFALASSTMSHMTSALKKMHFPVVLIIPITVMARFFHTAREDYNQVKDAMYLHGLTNRRLFFHPVKLFEYRMVPLFMVLTKTADDVAVSAMTRGLKIHGKRTYIGESRFCMRDYICFLLMLVLIGFYIGGKYVCV